MTFRAAGVAHLSTIDGDDVMILEIPPDSFSCNLKALEEATISMSVREARQLDDATSKQTALGGS